MLKNMSNKAEVDLIPNDQEQKKQEIAQNIQPLSLLLQMILFQMERDTGENIVKAAVFFFLC